MWAGRLWAELRLWRDALRNVSNERRAEKTRQRAREISNRHRDPLTGSLYRGGKLIDRTRREREAELRAEGLDPIIGWGEHGSELQFEYGGRQRRVSRWAETKIYIHGFSATDGAERTFRKDKIKRWRSGRDLLWEA